MTHDAALIAALQELDSSGIPIIVVEDLRSLADELMQHEAAVALLDAQALGVPADAAVDAVKNQFPEALLMVAGHAAEQNLLAGRIADQKVFRFVHKPASAQRLRLFFEAATQTGERQSTGNTQMQRALTPPATPPGGSSLLPILGGVAGVVVLAVGGWMLMRKEAAPAAAGSEVAAPATASPEMAALVERAGRAFTAGDFVAADGSSAAELYRQAMRLDSTHAPAADGFKRSIESALGGAEQALLAGQLEQARVTAELVRLIDPENSRLAFLYTQIERELARVNADASQRQAFEARQAQIRAAVETVEQRIARGALLEPADNAVARFRDAQSVGGGDPLVRGARDSLVAALLTAADRELSADRPAAARRFVEAAGTVNSSAPGLDFARRRIDEALIQQAALSTAAATPAPAPVVAAPLVATPPAATTPAPAPAATQPAARASEPAAAAPVSDVVSAASLRVVRRVEPEFPQQALRNLVSGWVEMEFTVATDGSVRDVAVIESEPRRTFDSAAMTAMRRYRYEPVLRNGTPVEQRARIRMRFTAQDVR